MLKINVQANENDEIVDCGILYKIIKNQYLDDFVSGRLYMKNLAYFHNIEEGAIGDKMEGLAFLGTEGKLLFKGEEVALVKNVKVYGNLKKPVLCFSYPYFKKMGSLYRSVISKKAINSITQGNDNTYSLVFVDKEKLTNRINEKLTKENLSAKYGFVKYNNSGYELEKEKLGENSGFIKRDIYAYQNEYRYIIDISIDDHYVLDLGDMNDIVQVFPVDSGQDIPLEYIFNV